MKKCSKSPQTYGFSIDTEHASYNATTVIWAGGEFSNPKLGNFEGNEHCIPVNSVTGKIMKAMRHL